MASSGDAQCFIVCQAVFVEVEEKRTNSGRWGKHIDLYCSEGTTRKWVIKSCACGKSRMFKDLKEH